MLGPCCATATRPHRGLLALVPAPFIACREYAAEVAQCRASAAERQHLDATLSAALANQVGCLLPVGSHWSCWHALQFTTLLLVCTPYYTLTHTTLEHTELA